jgi:hypothetical protein
MMPRIHVVPAGTVRDVVKASDSIFASFAPP